MKGSIDILNFLKESSTVKDKLNENQINNFREVRNSVSDEFEKYCKPSETALNYIDQLLEVSERHNSFNKRKELGTRLNFSIIFLAMGRFLIDELIL